MSRKTIHWLSLVVALIVPQIVGGLGGIATASSVSTWYRDLRKPAWNPPGWIFAPVWTLLYLLMATASWLVWKERHENRSAAGALRLYGVQLLLNGLWSPIFFGLRRVDLALVEIVPLWGVILATLIKFYRVRPIAGVLLIPYQLWGTFATLLNASIWALNRRRT